jgi:NitT/TauT family transport system permease protein
MRPEMRMSDPWLRVASTVVFIVVWQVGANLAASEVLPSPIAVAAGIYEHVSQGELAFHVAVTLARVAVSFAIAMAIGTAVGILMGRSRSANALLDGMLILGLNIPALVIIILCYVWFGLTEIAAILAVSINKIPVVVVTMREGARAIDAELLQVAESFRLPRGRTFRRIYLPQLYPYAMASARSGLALVWKIVLVVELLGRSNGVGFKLAEFFQFFDIVGILAYSLVFIAAVLLIELFGFAPLDRRVAAWRT